MTQEETIIEVVKLMIREKLSVEDGEVYIHNKKQFAYQVFNLFKEYYPEWVKEELKGYDYEL